MDSFERQRARVMWNSHVSDYFSISNGVKARHWSLKKILQKGIIYRYYYIKRLVVTSLEDITPQKNIFFMVAILNNKMASTDRDYSPFYNLVFSVMAEDRSINSFCILYNNFYRVQCHEIIFRIDFQIIIKNKIKMYKNLFLKTLF